MLIYFLQILCFSANQSQHDLFPRGIGYMTVNSTNGLTHSIPASYFSKVLIAIISKTQNAKVSFPSSKSPSVNAILAGTNSVVNIDFEPGDEGSVTFAFSELARNNCDEAIVITSNDYNFSAVDDKIKKDICILYAPKGKYLQYNLLNAKMNSKSDSLTVFRESTRGSWYDRYENIDYQSGWSATSDKPWFFVFRKSAEAEILLSLRCTLDEDPNLLTYAEKAEKTESLPLGVYKHSTIIAVLGYLPPALLLASWIFAYFCLQMKGTQ